MAEVLQKKLVDFGFLKSYDTNIKQHIADAVAVAQAAATTAIAATGEGISVSSATQTDGSTLYTINQNIKFKYVAATANTAAEGQPSNAVAAHIDLVDKTNEATILASFNVADIVGNGVLASSSYSEDTGVLTLNFNNADGTTTAAEVDLAKMLDINDMSIAEASQKYLGVDLTGAENSQAVFSAKIKKLADAVVGKAAVGTEGKEGYQAAVEEVTGLADAADVKAAIEATAKTADEAIKALDVESNDVTGTNVTVKYKEEDGIVTVESVSESYATVTRTAHADEIPGETPVPEVKAAIEFTSGDSEKLVKAKDLNAVADYAKDIVAEEEARAKAEIAALADNKTGKDENEMVTITVATAKGNVSSVTVAVTLAGDDEMEELFPTTNEGGE